MQVVMMFKTALLLYTAVIAPVQICLWNYDDDPCNRFPTLYFDVVVDLFFVLDAFLPFLVGYYTSEHEYIDEWRVVAAHVSMSFSSFWFDCVTSIPWSWIDLQVFLTCASQVSGTSGDSRVVRAAKVFRAFRIIRILKIVNMEFLGLIEDYIVLSIGIALYKVARLLFVAMMCVHVFACLFYRVKKESAVQPEDVDAFYLSRNSNAEDLTSAYVSSDCFF